ncbi:hypothetical protein [Bacillus sp. NEB1478]|uniref:hypothetical protein n=1 Tax=Bacillus sp. NEB1478 TaxID=3073816 RepID=UPI0028733861|nr:hypothetical protein [Bacillus sp. NEB1478]WNB92119.1 hypothetical protein RGB74_00215 [Bacillus sp. NEB1478]
METEKQPHENERSDHSLTALSHLGAVLSTREEQAFMSILFSSSATLREGNFGLPRKEVEKQLGVTADDAYFTSFLNRVNQAVGRYYKLIYDEKRDQVVIMIRVSARDARTTLSSESLAILLFVFYQQEVLQHEYTLMSQLLQAFGHEVLKGTRQISVNISILKKIGAISDYEFSTTDPAYQITTIGANLFSDSFLRRAVEFSHSTQLSKEDVLKFFKRYNLFIGEGMI